MKVLLVILAIFGISLVEGCGRPSMMQGTRIIGGEIARKGAWPWQVSLYYKRRFMCGGSLLNAEWIITAAHCVDGFDSSKYDVVLGDHDRSTLDHDEQAFKTVSAFTHPSWDKYKLNNDIALIKLSKPAIFTKWVRPVCLPSNAVKIGTTCFITGWGQYNVGKSGPAAHVLKQASMKVISQQTCAALNTRVLHIKITDKMVCGESNRQVRDSGCHGDSGGPFVCKNNLGAWELQGSVSWGSGICDTKQGYTVFANIYNFKSWIEKYIS